MSRSSGVRWGRIATDPDNLEAVAADGFDSAEFTVDLLMSPPDAGFRELKTRFEASPLTFDVVSGLLPAGVVVTELGFNIYVWSEYLKRALDRVAAIGASAVVWSGGKSRLLPVEGEVDSAKRQAYQFLYMVCDIARSNGISVLIEPLDPRRTNYLNSMHEVDELIHQSGKSNLSSLISLRDLNAIGFNEEDFLTFKSRIAHIYMENPAGIGGERLAPREGDGQDYRRFADHLDAMGYNGSITLPGDADAAALMFCRSQFRSSSTR